MENLHVEDIDMEYTLPLHLFHPLRNEANSRPQPVIAPSVYALVGPEPVPVDQLTLVESPTPAAR